MDSLRLRGCSPLLRLFFLLVLSTSALDETEAAGEQVRPCRARHPTRDDVLTDGRCRPVHECLDSLKDIGRLKFPTFCGVDILLPIVCCPLSEPPPSSPEPARSAGIPGRTPQSQPPRPVSNEGPPEAGPAADCEMPSGQRGSCVPLVSCEAHSERVRRKDFPPLCDLRGSTPYACCPSPPLFPASGTRAAMEATPQPSGTPSPPLNRAIRMAQLMFENSRYCGKTSGAHSRRARARVFPTVTGGRSVNLGAYPFAVAIFRDQVSLLNYWCGGTLITSRVVLSAAHCFYYSLNNTVYHARIGGVNISDTSSGRYLQRTVASVHLHPDYDDRRHYNDVALLVLNLPARHRTIERLLACLPDANAAFPTATHGTVLGWGHNSFGGTLQAILQEAQVPLVDNAACDRAYHSLGSYEREFPNGINEHFICAGNTTAGGVDACQQDSGGPLIVDVQRDGETYHEVIGVVSFGVGCGSAAYPGVYTSVSHFLPWILNTTIHVTPVDAAYDSANFV